MRFEVEFFQHSVAHVEPRHVLDDPRIPFRPVDAGHGVEPDPVLSGVDLEPEAVVLDLVDRQRPAPSRSGSAGRGR